MAKNKQQGKAIFEGRVLFAPPADNQYQPAPIVDGRVIKSTGSRVLVYENAEVIVPASFRWPKVIAEGDIYAAFWIWEYDEGSKGMRRHFKFIEASDYDPSEWGPRIEASFEYEASLESIGDDNEGDL